MKKFSIILFALFAGTAFAQNSNSATAVVNATLVSPISIESSRGLNFGTIAQESTGGNVRIAHDASGTRTFSNTSMEVLTSVETPTSAMFQITAPEGYTYGISIPATSLTLGDFEIPVSFTHNMKSTGNAGGLQDVLYVGGLLDVSGNEDPGTYVGEVSVTVTYE